MYITSSLSEGEKTCSLRSRKEATATGRQCLHPTDSVVANAFCLASVATKRCAPRCLVFPRSREIATPLLYKQNLPLSSLFPQKGLTKRKKYAMIKIRGNTGDGCLLRSVKNNRQGLETMGGYFFLFCMSITNFTTASTKVPSRRSSSKVMYIGHHLPPENPEKGKKFSHPPVRRKQPPPAGSACIRQNPSYAGAFLPCVCRNKAMCAPLLGVSKVARNRDSSIIQGKPIVVKSLLSKRL